MLSDTHKDKDDWEYHQRHGELTLVLVNLKLHFPAPTTVQGREGQIHHLGF